MEEVADDELLRRHVAGDSTAFDTLLRRHKDRLWSVALRTTGHPQDAEDALQDAMLNAYRRAGSFRGDAAVTTWLHRIVVNACIDRARSRSARPTQPLLDASGASDIADRRDAVAEREAALDVASALSQIPDDQRAAIVLVDIEGMSVDEASRALGVPSGTVKSRCARGRVRLAQLLRDDAGRNGQAPANVPQEGPMKGGDGT